VGRTIRLVAFRHFGYEIHVVIIIGRRHSAAFQTLLAQLSSQRMVDYTVKQAATTLVSVLQKCVVVVDSITVTVSIVTVIDEARR
jgi:hypothetical protein